MRVVLREIRTGLFVQGTGVWTEKLDEAKTFRHSAEAMDAARLNGLDGLEVLLAFEQPEYNVSLPLPPC